MTREPAECAMVLAASPLRRDCERVGDQQQTPALDEQQASAPAEGSRLRSEEKRGPVGWWRGRVRWGLCSRREGTCVASEGGAAAGSAAAVR